MRGIERQTVKKYPINPNTSLYRRTKHLRSYLKTHTSGSSPNNSKTPRTGRTAWKKAKTFLGGNCSALLQLPIALSKKARLLFGLTNQALPLMSNKGCSCKGNQKSHRHKWLRRNIIDHDLSFGGFHSDKIMSLRRKRQKRGSKRALWASKTEWTSYLRIWILPFAGTRIQKAKNQKTARSG